jgi:hypothetical protein
MQDDQDFLVYLIQHNEQYDHVGIFYGMNISIQQFLDCVF